jgi:hypothetical protein
MDLRIVPERFVDTRLTEILLRLQVSHQHGSGDVARQLKTSLTNKQAIGIIDEDAKKGVKPQYFSEFLMLRKVHNLLLKKHKVKEHYLIVICPEIEHWLLEIASLSNIDPSEYKFSPDIKDFRNQTKTGDIRKNAEFERFIRDLFKNGEPGLVTLHSWLRSFQEQTIIQFHKL